MLFARAERFSEFAHHVFRDSQDIIALVLPSSAERRIA